MNATKAVAKIKPEKIFALERGFTRDVCIISAVLD